MSTQNVASLVSGNTLIVFLDGTQYTIGKDHKNYQKIRDALTNKEYDLIPELADIRSTVKRWISEDVEFSLDGDLISLEGDTFSEAVTDKVLRLIDDGQSPDSLFNFLRKVRQNPSKTAQDELLLFCVANNFLIHEDGDVIAYKSVRGDYKDIHSGTFLNTVGSVQEMPRWKVDDNRDRTCSQGLHFAAYDYASTWSGTIDGVNRRLLLIKVNPADVVSIPSDYSNQKGRTWRYEVAAEITTSGAPLPEKEVYTDEDINGFNEYSEAQALRDEIDINNESLQDLNETLAALRVEEVEFAASGDLDSLDSVRFDIEATLQEIADLEDHLAVLENSLSEVLEDEF